jgi:hypothetical protein
VRGDKADGTLLLLGRGHEFADGTEDAGDGLIVRAELGFDGVNGTPSNCCHVGAYTSDRKGAHISPTLKLASHTAAQNPTKCGHSLHPLGRQGTHLGADRASVSHSLFARTGISYADLLRSLLQQDAHLIDELRRVASQIAVAHIKLLKFIRIIPEPVLLLPPGTRHIVIVGDLTLWNIDRR